MRPLVLCERWSLVTPLPIVLRKKRLTDMHRCCQPFRVHCPRPLCFDYELHILILLYGLLLPVRCVGHCDCCPYLAHITSHVCWKSLVLFHDMSLNVSHSIRLYLSLNRKGAFTSMIGLELGWTCSYSLHQCFLFNLTTILSAFLWILWVALGGNSAGMLWLGDCGYWSKWSI